MSKNILIAGKDFPDSEDFAEKLALGEYNVIAAGKLSSGNDASDAKAPQNTDNKATGGISVVSWNRDSAISARSLIIQAETLHGFTENFILYFDAAYFTSKYESCSADICARAADTMILGFQYLTLEILNRAKQHRSPVKLVFLLKSHPTYSEVLHSSAARKMNLTPSNPIVAASEAAFATFAENVAAMTNDDEFVSVLLLTGDQTNETCKNDSTLASWLKDYLTACDQLKKGVPKSTNWTKAGAKAPGGFSLFR